MNNIKKIVIISVIFLVLLWIAYIVLSNFIVLPIKKSLDKSEDELMHLQELERYYNINVYEEKKPCFATASDFINSYKADNKSDIFSNAEKQDFRSAVVEVIMGENLLMYELIGFNTTDEGLIFFETDTGYQVNPEIGKSYIECVVGRPYSMNTFNDTIRDILIIW